MGSVSDGAYGEADFGGGLGSSDMDGMSKDQFDSFANVVEATQGDFYSSPNQELDFGAGPSLDDIDPDADLIDFSNPTREGAEPLKGNFSDFLKNLDYEEALDKLSGGGKGFGPESLGKSGLPKNPGENYSARRGFRNIMGDSPYQAPSYYSPQGSVLYQNMAQDLIKGLLASTIRKPSIRSLV